jgi:hypothetical protein
MPIQQGRIGGFDWRQPLDQFIDSIKAIELLKKYTSEIDRQVEDIFKNPLTDLIIHLILLLTPSRRPQASPLLKQ